MSISPPPMTIFSMMASTTLRLSSDGSHVDSGDLAGAAACFSISASEKYLESFLNLGTANVQSAINDIGALTPSDVEDENAEYYFTQAIGGQTITFPVEFVKENGVWKILEF